MRDIDDLKNAFGGADDGFQNNVRLTLGALQKGEEKTSVRKMSLRLVVAIAMACVTLTATALALTNTWGILDFLSGRRSDAEVLPGAAHIVQKDVPQVGGQADLATFQVREAIFDGQDIYIVVEAKPVQPEYLLMGLDANLSDPIGNMGPLFDGQGGTIDDYAKKNDMTPIHTSVLLNLNGSSADFVLEDDGTLVYMLNGRYVDEHSQLTLELNCVTSPFFDGSIRMEDLQRNTLTVTLQNTGTKDTISSATPVVYRDCGVRVDKITLVGTEMSIYAEIEYTVVDAEAFAATDGGLWFEFIDENGERLPNGASSGGGTESLDESGTRFVQKESLQASEVLPHEIILRGFNIWEKNRYESHTFELE